MNAAHSKKGRKRKEKSLKAAAAAHLRHALHVQLDEVSLVILQDGQAHPEDDLQPLHTSNRRVLQP